MFRSRRLLTALVALAVIPLFGCGSWRCCRNTAARPVYAAPAPGCNSCGSSPVGAPVVVGH
jgi:hypothetical protein